MTYEEKRELRLQISQLLADAGVNQKTIKNMVETEIKNKVDRAIEQAINSLNSECSSGNFVRQRIDSVEYPFYKYICGVTGLTCCGCSLFCEHRREKNE